MSATDLAHSVLHYQRMRLCLPFVLGLILAGCSLSMNPDLPSAEESESGPIFGGDGDQDISIGDGDALGEPDGAASGGLGGSTQTCETMGGEGGVPGCEGDP